MCECGCKGVKVFMSGAYVLQMRLALLGRAAGLREELVRYN